MGLLDFVVGAAGTLANPVAMSKRVIIGLCKQKGIQTQLIPDEAFEEMTKLIKRSIDDLEKYITVSKIEKADMVNKNGEKISIAVFNYLSASPDTDSIDSWNKKEIFDDTYDTMKILNDYGVKSPWTN